MEVFKLHILKVVILKHLGESKILILNNGETINQYK